MARQGYMSTEAKAKAKIYNSTVVHEGPSSKATRHMRPDFHCMFPSGI